MRTCTVTLVSVTTGLGKQRTLCFLTTTVAICVQCTQYTCCLAVGKLCRHQEFVSGAIAASLTSLAAQQQVMNCGRILQCLDTAVMQNTWSTLAATRTHGSCCAQTRLATDTAEFFLSANFTRFETFDKQAPFVQLSSFSTVVKSDDVEENAWHHCSQASVVVLCVP